MHIHSRFFFGVLCSVDSFFPLRYQLGNVFERQLNEGIGRVTKTSLKLINQSMNFGLDLCRGFSSKNCPCPPCNGRSLQVHHGRDIFYTTAWLFLVAHFNLPRLALSDRRSRSRVRQKCRPISIVIISLQAERRVISASLTATSADHQSLKRASNDSFESNPVAL